jgi:hypothetical protein
MVDEDMELRVAARLRSVENMSCKETKKEPGSPDGGLRRLTLEGAARIWLCTRLGGASLWSIASELL